MANLGLKNNNPGNLKDPATGNFRVFPNPQSGYDALKNDLAFKTSGQAKIVSPQSSLTDFSKVWAPASDNNDPNNYANTLSKELGVASSTPIGNYASNLDPLAHAIMGAEGTSTMDFGNNDIPDSPINSFADKIKQKYPEYADMADSELSQKILQKYPQYQDMVSGGQTYTQPATSANQTSPTANDPNFNQGSFGSLGGLIENNLKNTNPDETMSATNNANLAAGLGALAVGTFGVAAPWYTKILEGLGIADVADKVLGTKEGQPTSTSDQSAQQGSQTPTMAQLLSLQSQMPQAIEGSNKAKTALEQNLGGLVGGRNALADPNLQEGIQTSAMYGAVPIQNDRGINDSTAGIKKLDSHISEISNNLKPVLSNEWSNVEDAVAQARAAVPKLYPNRRGEWAQAEDAAEQSVRAIAKTFNEKGGKLSHAQMNEGKSSAWGHYEASDTAPIRMGKKAAGFGFRATIQNNTKHKDLYRASMKEEQRLFNAKKILKILHNKKAPEHTGLLKRAMKGIGSFGAIYIGDKIGGPLGAIIANMARDKVIRAADKRYGKTIFETPGMHSQIDKLKSKNPAVYDALIAILKKEGVSIKHKEKGKKVEVLGEQPKGGVLQKLIKKEDVRKLERKGQTEAKPKTKESLPLKEKGK